MKISTNMSLSKIGRIAATLLLTAFVICLSACSKNETETPAISGLMVVNASPGYGTFNLYINNVSSPVNTKGALPFLGTISPYFNITPGTNTLKFTTASSTESLFSQATTLEADKAYSYFLINNTPNLEGLLIQDDLSLTSSEKGFIRFINLSPDAGALDLSVTGGTNLATDKSYKSATEFLSVDAKPYSFELKDKVSGQVIATLKDVTITAGKMYTIVAAGMLSPGELQQTVRLEVITNR